VQVLTNKSCRLRISVRMSQEKVEEVGAAVDVHLVLFPVFFFLFFIVFFLVV
jgi:hypothetical protein